jgi:hypothetical protein
LYWLLSVLSLLSLLTSLSSFFTSLSSHFSFFFSLFLSPLSSFFSFFFLLSLSSLFSIWTFFEILYFIFSFLFSNEQLEKVLLSLPRLDPNSTECPTEMKVIGADVYMSGKPVRLLYYDGEEVLLARKCVRQIVRDLFIPAAKLEEMRGFVVVGTPGIGKTTLTNWVIASMRTQFPERPIVLHDWKSEKVPWIRLIEGNNVFELSVEDLGRRLNDPSLIYLADTGTGGSSGAPHHRGFAMITASPASAPKEYLKNSKHVKQVILPPWTKDECDAAFAAMAQLEPPPAHLPSREEYERRFQFAGGIPRCLFGSSAYAAQYKDRFERTIAS